MDILEIQVDHYKETCEIQRENIKVRNRLFIFMWIDLFVLYLFLFSQNETVSVIQSWLKDKIGVDVLFSPSIFLALGWVLLLFFCIRYIQINVAIERNYQYINILEEEIASKGCKVFSREGKSYLDKYPFVLKYIDVLYKWFFPILLNVVVIIKIILEIISHQNIIGLIVDSLVALAVVLLWIMYLIFIYSVYKK